MVFDVAFNLLSVDCLLGADSLLFFARLLVGFLGSVDMLGNVAGFLSD